MVVGKRKSMSVPNISYVLLVHVFASQFLDYNNQFLCFTVYFKTRRDVLVPFKDIKITFHWCLFEDYKLEDSSHYFSTHFHLFMFSHLFPHKPKLSYPKMDAVLLYSLPPSLPPPKYTHTHISLPAHWTRQTWPLNLPGEELIFCHWTGSIYQAQNSHIFRIGFSLQKKRSKIAI